MSKVLHSKIALGTVQFGMDFGISNTGGKTPEDEYRFKRLKNCEDEFKPYDSENDYGLYSDISLTAESGDAVLIDTNLAHMALCGRGHVKKLVIKIPK